MLECMKLAHMLGTFNEVSMKSVTFGMMRRTKWIELTQISSKTTRQINFIYLSKVNNK